MAAYYNEIDPSAAQWLRNLIEAGHIAPGHVDERSIEDVTPGDLAGYTQCHFFAGIGVWSYALRRAGWPDDLPVWTGSCPCQPFSAAGKGNGFNDERHLWPVFFKLIATCKPNIVFGEQVASSGVMGNADEGLYGLRGGQTPGSVSSIYRAREIWCPPSLQDMPKRIRKEMALKFKRIQEETEREKGGKSEGLLSGVSIRKQGKISNLGMQASLFEEGDTVRSRYLSEGDSGKDKCGCVRSVGCESEFDSFGGEAVQHSVNRSDSARRGVCLQKHTDNSICRECDDGRLGRESGARDNAIVDSEEGLKNDERRTTTENNKKPYGETAPSWIDAVFDDLEGSGYACAAVAFPSAGVGAPHIRDRLFWVGYSDQPRPQGHAGHGGAEGRQGSSGSTTEAGVSGGLADSADFGREQGRSREPEEERHGSSGDRGAAAGHAEPRGLADADGGRIQEAGWRPEARTRQPGAGQEPGPTGPTNGIWADADWLFCRDGKWRPVEPGTFPLAHGAPARVVRLRAYGNAINAEAAREFIEAYLDTQDNCSMTR